MNQIAFSDCSLSEGVCLSAFFGLNATIWQGLLLTTGSERAGLFLKSRRFRLKRVHWTSLP